jgi:tetratricopeptide (TPR) repeat protein
MNPTPEQSGRLKQLFAEALELAPPLLDALLARVRDQEGAPMADHLQALLAAHSAETESMFQPLVRPGLSFPSAQSAFEEGELILQRFRIIGLLGRGGMGEVYQAEDAEIGRVALKTIRHDTPGDSSLLRFKREVQLARMVTSPYVCRIHEFFTTPAEGQRSSIAFLTMEFLPGETLADRIARQGPLPWRDAEAIALQLCEGLQAVHGAGIIHRDFKSRNIMLTTHNGAIRAVVMDLGLARRPDLAETLPKDSAQLTLAGTVMGTPDYMAPEQFESATVSAATDIYAFGVVLYEMVTGKLPFEAPTPIAAAVRRAKYPPSVSSIQPGVPHRWDAVIKKCLQYDPALRFHSAAEVAAALQRPSVAKASLNALIADPARRRRSVFVLACLGLIAAVLLGFKGYQASTSHNVPAAAQNYYDEATKAFHNASYLTATRQLQEAVKLDPDFALAHARLADAFNELDFTEEAQREVNQIKEELVSQLSSIEKTYIHAVRETIRPDLNAALKDYQKLLAATEPPSERASALVDLARTNERSGKIADSMAGYSQAIRFNPYSPTPHLRKGILESRQGKLAEADSDFSTADKLYGTNISQEGRAEVDYQRGVLATKLGPAHEHEARKFFQESLAATERMQSVALHVRALSRLSTIEYGLGNDEQAAGIADEAIHLAEKDDVAYWATDARVRFGNSWTYRDRTKAEEILRRAQTEALRSRWPRLLALSQVSLAALLDQQQKLQTQRQVIDLALPAYDYYRRFGFPQEAFQCQALLSRAKAFVGLLSESLQHATTALELAGNLVNPIDLLQAQEAVGSALLWKEDYPAALEHLTTAFQMAKGMPGDYPAAEALLRAEALSRLGRFDEAKLTLAAIPNSTWQAGGETSLEFARLQAELLMSQGKYKEGLLISQKILPKAGGSSEHWDIRLTVGQGLTHSGNAAKTVALCDEMLPSAAEQSPITVAESKLVKAGALLELRQWQSARILAHEAGQVFRDAGQKESELVSLWLLARSYRGAGSLAEANAPVEKIRDILSDFQHNFGADNYPLFAKRSEIAEIVSGVNQHQITSSAASPDGMERKTQ